MFSSKMYPERHKQRDARQSTSRKSAPRSNQIQQDSNYVSKELRRHVCQNCRAHYDCIYRGSGIVGRIPMILPCNHTICYECLQRTFKHHQKVTCCECKATTVPKPHSKVFDEFRPNFCLLGKILWARYSNVNCTPSPSSDTFRLIPQMEKELELIDDNFEKCSYVTCNKRAQLRCPECDDVYCNECSQNLHQSARAMWNHRPEKIVIKDKLSFELEICQDSEHNGMVMDLFCIKCNEYLCCYCVLEKHSDHERINLTKLEEMEKLEMEAFKERASKLHHTLLLTQLKVKRLSDSKMVSNVEMEISQYFLKLSNKIQTIEENLLKEVQSLEKNSVGLGRINTTLNTSINNIQKLLNYSEKACTKKYNLKKLLEHLREIDSIPAHLITADGSAEPIRFIKNFDFAQLDQLSIEFEESQEFKLVTSSELPEDYVEPLLLASEDSEDSVSLKNEEIPFTIHKQTKNKKSSPSSLSTIKKSYLNVDYERVIVTHIKSINCIYLQLHKDQSKIRQIDNHVKRYCENHHGPPKFINIGSLYLGLYKSKTEKQWCRIRIESIVNNSETNTTYEVFFIDYGYTQILDKSLIRMIPEDLLRQVPYIKECQLKNPSSTPWHPQAHKHLAKIIHNKELYMKILENMFTIFTINLYIYSSSSGFTPVIDLLFNTCRNVLSSTSSTSSNTMDHFVLTDVKIFKNSYKFTSEQVERVVIASVVNPEKIYVHIEQNVESLNRLIGLMKKHFCTTSPDQFTPQIGMYVVVEHRDRVRGNYHRAQVKNIQPATETMTVNLIDWGFEATIPWNKSRILTENLTKLETQAILIKLADIKPLYDQVEWPINANDNLIRIFSIRETLKMVVHKTKPVLQVALFQMSNDCDYCINAKLVEMNVAESTGDLSKTVEWIHLTADTNQNKNDNENTIITTMLNNIDLFDEDLNESEDLIKKMKQPINIIKIDSPGLIYIKFAIHSITETQLKHELQVNYSAERIIKEKPDEWQIGEKCVVFLTYDVEYTRGIIMEKRQDDEYLIYLYDKAVEILKDTQNIFKSSPYFDDGFPKMLYKSHLANIKPAGDKEGQWSVLSKEVLEELIKRYNNIFVTRVNDSALTSPTNNKSVPVEMWFQEICEGDALHPAKIKYISVNNLLVKLGVAYRDPESLITKKQINQNDTIQIDDENDECMDDEPLRIVIKDWVPALPLTKTVFNAWLLFADETGNVFIRSEELQTPYDELETNMTRECEQRKLTNLEPELKWAPNQLCTIKYNRKYYRGRVRYTLNDDFVNVLMVDFGSEHDLNRNDLFKEIFYYEIPILANKVCLVDVYGKKQGKWLSSDYDKLMGIIKEYARIEIINSDGIYPMVEIYDEDVSLNERIVQLCPNLTRDKNWFKDNEEADGSSSEDAVIVLEETEDIDMIISDGQSEDEKLTNLHYVQDNKPVTGDIVCVMHVIDYKTIVICGEKLSKEYETKLTDLANELDKSQHKLLDKDCIKINQPCIATYMNDGHYYRGQIQSVFGMECDQVMVFYVDFGNVDILSIDQLYEMKAEWFQLPVMHFIVELNFQLNNQKYDSHVLKQIQKLEEKKKVVRIVQQDPWIVDLLESNGNELSYQVLFDRGFIMPLNS